MPSYRIAVEEEFGRWKPFREGLASDEKQQAFDELMDWLGVTRWLVATLVTRFSLNLWQ